MRMFTLNALFGVMLVIGLPCGRVQAAPLESSPSAIRATEVMDHIQKHFWDEKRNLFYTAIDKHEPDMIWGSGVMFSALVGGSRHDPRYRPVMRKFFEAMNGYWDDKARVPGYEPAPTAGNGHDKYYDDNAWMVLTFMEAYQLTREPRYSKRAEETLNFVLSGHDQEGGGGVWWHELHRDGTKNTCVNGPAAVGCFEVAGFLDGKSSAGLIEQGTSIVEWTVKNLQAPNGLFSDSKNIATGAVNRDQLTYNAALMLRAFLGLYHHTGKPEYLAEAKRIGKAAEGLLDSRNGAYRDAVKWSHLMTEADLQLHRVTKEDYLLQRAIKNGEAHYAAWKAEPPKDLLANASIARELWLLADAETKVGQDFWSAVDGVRK